VPDFTGHLNPRPPGGIPPEFVSFWDTEQYQGVFSAGTFVEPLGLAEYSSFYYVTDDSLFPANNYTNIAGVWTVTLNNDPSQTSHFDDTLGCFFPRLEHTNLLAILPPGTHSLIRWGHNPPAPSHAIPLSLNFGSVTLDNFCSLEYYNIGASRQYNGISLRDENYRAHAASLLPKAVAYSAGVLKYFFRAKINVTLSREARQNKLTVVNQSGEDFVDGQWVVMRENVAGGYEPIPNLQISAPNTLPPGGMVTILYPDDDLCKPIGTITVAYRGRIGHEEDAIAVKRIAPPVVEFTGQARYTYAGGCAFSPTIPIRIHIQRQFQDHVQAFFEFLPQPGGATSNLRLNCGAAGSSFMLTEAGGVPSLPWWEATVSQMGNHLQGVERHFGGPIGNYRVIGTITLDRTD
jgi:hypothetical protein